MENKHIAVVLGTAREGRASEGVATAVVDVINTMEGHSSELVDVRDHVTAAVTVPPWGVGGADENPTEWKSIVEKSHGLVLVTPEYNHSIPGELKLLLDSLTNSYVGKAVGLVGVTAGTLGAARVMDHVRPILNTLNMHVVKNGVHVSSVGEAVGSDGGFADPKTAEYTQKMVEEISKLSTALATMKK
ncbi:MAG: NAD(P)H-dependent FMN reductase [Candidatus Paceibacteria bacterium]|jgi:NAD(P)H-dependent FMN reductase